MEMNSKTQIRSDSVEQAHRTLDALPQHRPDALTKTQAIQQLIVPIRAAQSKGYSLAAIGKVLSDSGIPITTGALRAYVSEANAGVGGKRKRKGKRATAAPKEAQLGETRSGQGAAAAQPPAPAPKPAEAGAPRTVDLDWEPAARSDKPALSTGSAPRPGVYVRPDRKVI
jgi:hypothetical protein